MVTEPLVFDPATLSCQAWVLSGARMTLRHLSELERPAAAARAGQEAIRDWDDPLEVHRGLLVARRHARSGCPTWAHRLDADIRAVRAHSSLYGPRTCRCADRAWAVFQDAVRARLAEATHQARALSWAATVNGAHRPDVLALWDDLLGQLAAWPARIGTDGPWDGPTRLRRVEVTFATTPRVVIEARTDFGARQVRARLEAMRGALADAAQRMDTDRRTGKGTGTGSWALTWPDALHRTVVAWPDLHDVRADALARALLKAGFSRWPQVRQDACALLADGWQGTPAELVSAAAVTAA